MNRRALSLLALTASMVSSLSLPAWAADSASMPETKSLYDRLGGEAAITAVVEDFVGRAAADPAVNFTRQGAAKPWDPTPENVSKLKMRLVQFISMATGGPQKYEGKDMRGAHAGMAISNAEFDALAADLKASLVTLNVPQKEQDDLLAVVGTTRKDIVESSGAPMTAPESKSSY